MKNSTADLKKALKTVEEKLHLYLVDKAPTLPKDIKEMLVALTPWVTLIGVVITALGFLVLFGITAIFSPFAYLSQTSVGLTGLATIWLIILSLPSLVLEAMAVPGLIKKSRKGWNLLFYSLLLTAVYDIVTFSPIGLVRTGVFLYILFQIREYYK